MTRSFVVASALAVAVVIAAAAACGKKEEPAPAASSGSANATAAGSAPATATPAPAPTGAAPSEADCDKLGAHTAALSMGQTPPGTPPDRVAKLTEISDEAGRAIATLCKTDGWSADAVACGLASKDPARDCNDKLTDTQKTKMQAQVMAIFAKAAPP